MSAIKVPVQLVVSGADALKKALGPTVDKARAAKLAREQLATDKRVNAARLANLQRLSKAELALRLKNQLEVQRNAQQRARQELATSRRSEAAKLAVIQSAARASLREKQAAARAELSHANAIERIELSAELRKAKGVSAAHKAEARAALQLSQATARAELSQTQAAARNRLAKLQAAAVAERAAITRSATAALAVRQRSARDALRAGQAQTRAQLQVLSADKQPGLIGRAASSLARAGVTAGKAFAAGFKRTANFAFNGVSFAASRALPRGFQAAGLAAARSFKLGLAGALVGGAIGVTALAAAAIKRTLTGGLRRLVAIDNATVLFKGLGASVNKTNDILGRTYSVVNGTRFAFDEAAKTAAGLFATGIRDGASLERTLKAVSGAATLTNTDFITMGKIFQKVAADNRVQQRELGQLGEHGLNITRALSKNMDVPIKKVREMASAGKISFKEFQRGVETAVVDAAKEGKNAVSGLARNVGTQMDKIGAAFLKPGFKQAPRILRDVTAGLKTLIKPAGSLGKSVFKDFLSTKNIKAFFKEIKTGIPKLKKFVDDVREFSKSDDFKNLVDSVKTLADALSSAAINAANLIELLTRGSKLRMEQATPPAPGTAKPALIPGVASAGVVPPPTLDVKKLQETFRNSGAAIGTALVAGTTSGVATATPGAVPTITQKFQSFVDGVKNLFGIHSPSTVFIAIGGDIIAGFIQGVTTAGATLLGLAGQVFGPFINGAKTLLTNAGTSIASGFNTAKTAVVTTVGGIVAGAKARLGALPGALQGVASRAGSAISGGLKAATGAVGGAVSRIVSGARSRAAGLVTGLGSAASRAASAVGSRLRAGVSAAGAAASRIVSTARSRLAPMASQMGSAAGKAAQAVGSKIAAGAGRAGSAARSLAARAKAGLSGLRGGFTTAGAQAGAGLAAGIRSRLSSIASSAASIVRRAIKAAKDAQKSASPSKVYIGIGQDAGEGYAIGMASTTKLVAATAAKVVATGVKVASRSLAAQAKTLRVQLARAQAQVESLAEARSSFASTFSGTIDRLTAFTDKKTPNSLLAFLSKNLDKAKEFTTVMQQLREKGLGDAAFQQLAEAGADAGLAAANAISSGGPAVIDRVNSLLAAITKESNAFGNTAAKSLFDAGQQAANGMVKGLLARQNALIAAAKRISAKMVAAVRAALGINSPSRVMAERVGRHIFPGAVQGAEATLPQVTKDFRKMALSIVPTNPAVAARSAAPNAFAQPATARPVNVKVEQTFYGPTTGAERVRDLDWTLRYGTAPALDDLTGAAA